MRKIKFRGYDLDSKRWIYGGYHKHLDETPCLFSCKEEEEKWYKEHTKHLIIKDQFSDWWMPRGIDAYTTIDEKSVGEYTGMKDKNGKEIYEGDLVKITSLDYGLDKYYNKIGEIVFRECSFYIDLKNDGISLYTELLEYEVIGNNYEKENKK